MRHSTREEAILATNGARHLGPFARLCTIFALALLAGIGGSGCVTVGKEKGAPQPISSAFIEWTNFSGFARQAQSNQLALVSPKMPVSSFTELVVSWNAQLPEAAGLKVEARVGAPTYETKFYTLGLWSDLTNARPRQSVRGQQDSFGKVLTDTLVLKQPASWLQIRIVLLPNTTGDVPTLKLVTASLIAQAMVRPESPPGPIAQTELAVPEISQLSYEHGREWCSPTCVSMVLNYWSQKLNRPDLRVDVPQVAAGVHDPNWRGTGNWPFNTAFAGHFAGMKGYVRRFDGLNELEPWISSGRPIIISIDTGLLMGRPRRGSGHLVVCRGFTDTGDVIINNPWADLERGGKVRRVHPRERVEAAWLASRNTAYVIFPETWQAGAR